MVTLYNVVSSDGYIAREDSGEEFIPDSLWEIFIDNCKKYDALVMGRKTYDAIQNYGKKLLSPFEKLRIKKIIVSGDKKFFPKPGYVIARTLKDAISSGNNVLVSSGPILNMELLKNNLVDKIILYVLPIVIGNGIKPFNKEVKKSFVLIENIDSVEGVKIYKYRIASK